MAKSRFALGQMFGAVASAANTVTTTFDALDETIGMASDFVTHTRYKQAVRYAGERKTYATEITAEVVRTRAEAEAEIKALVDEGKITAEDAADVAAEFKAELVALGLMTA